MNDRYFDHWSYNMSYILGFLFADGSVYTSKKGGKYLSIQIQDRDLLEFIAKELDCTQTITARNAHLHRLQIGSKRLCESLKRHGFTNNKTLRMRVPSVPPKYISAFLLGYFDGDGNVWSGALHTQRPTQSRGLLVSFTSISRGFLSDVLALTKSHGIEGGSLFKKGNAWRLNYGKKDALKLAENMYNSHTDFCLSRKKHRFDEFAVVA